MLRSRVWATFTFTFYWDTLRTTAFVDDVVFPHNRLRRGDASIGRPLIIITQWGAR